MDELKKLGKDPKFIEYYDHQEYQKACLRNAKDEGIEEGIEKGILEKTIDAAIRLFKNEIPKNIISKSLNITDKELDKILKEN